MRRFLLLACLLLVSCTNMYSYWTTFGYTNGEKKYELVGDYYPPLLEIDPDVFLWATLGNSVELDSDSFKSNCSGSFRSILLSFWTKRENVYLNIDDSYYYSDGVRKRLDLLDSYELASNTKKLRGSIELHSSKDEFNQYLNDQSFYPSQEQLSNSSRYLLKIKNDVDCQSKENYLVIGINNTIHKIELFSVKSRTLNR